MKTDRLIETLAMDAMPRAMPMRNAWIAAGLVGAALAALLFGMMLGPRADIGAAAGSLRFLFKFVVTLTLLGTALAALRALAAPGERARTALAGLLAAPLLLALACGLEFATLPPVEVFPRWLGSNALLCLVSIPVLGLAPLGAMLMVLRHGAPTRPRLAGGVAGLAAGGLAATFYAAHCIDDSPLFVATWYTLGIGVLVLSGAVAGRFVARW